VDSILYINSIDNRDYQIEIVDEKHILLNGEQYEFDLECIQDQTVYSMILNGRLFEAQVYVQDNTYQIYLDGRSFIVNVKDERSLRYNNKFGKQSGEQAVFYLRAPMPGMVVSIAVMEGQEVKEGDVLIILESMKMQNEIHSPRSGKVLNLQVKPGDRLTQQKILMSIG
jgi:biotin carboxyl carrier protein